MVLPRLPLRLLLQLEMPTRLSILRGAQPSALRIPKLTEMIIIIRKTSHLKTGKKSKRRTISQGSHDQLQHSDERMARRKGTFGRVCALRRIYLQRMPIDSFEKQENVIIGKKRERMGIPSGLCGASRTIGVTYTVKVTMSERRDGVLWDEGTDLHGTKMMMSKEMTNWKTVRIIRGVETGVMVIKEVAVVMNGSGTEGER